jgi:hypothetical protein
MEIVRAMGDVGFVVTLIGITMAPRITGLFLAARRKR